MYHYANNNPIKYSDPNGKDTYLVIWATGVDVGHAGFAVDNYKQITNEDGTISYVPDGTVTYYDLWPGQGITVDDSNVSENVKAGYNKYRLTLEELKTGSRDYLPDSRDAVRIIFEAFFKF